MRLYRFKTLKSEYYFPPLTQENKFIYSLYGNYGGKVAHVMWRMFLNSGLLRWVNRVDSLHVNGYEHLADLLGSECVFGINMGTKGPDQKKSALGYDLKTGSTFFAKLATKERAMSLSRNEIRVCQLLEGTGLTPRLYDYRDEKNFVFLKCECIKGKHVHGQIDNKQILETLLRLKEMHYVTCHVPPSALQTCFAHMDFCPWNMIDVDGQLRVIDWEMAAEMPLGFDLFTYLLQTHFLTVDAMTGNEVITANESLIDEYFEADRTEWQPYLDAFIDWKINFFSVGQHEPLLGKFKEMS